ncbi:hypothetical protein XENOCAPTIV_015297 [Xenoophorus captivus]|uniref:Profilin n=1 Tax=Xenoophorus captivus TaxID=1517983 RepID=A0ABV0QRZ6_9TELE
MGDPTRGIQAPDNVASRIIRALKGEAAAGFLLENSRWVPGDSTLHDTNCLKNATTVCFTVIFNVKGEALIVGKRPDSLDHIIRCTVLHVFFKIYKTISAQNTAYE